MSVPKSQQNMSPMPDSAGNTIQLDGALKYCRNLAKSHYENFIVGSMLVPRRLSQHLYNLYAFCRHSDDLADEVPDPEEAVRLLAEWRVELGLCYGGTPTHPILMALQTTIREFDIPATPFEDLLSAFEQDCRVTRYATYVELLDYCRRSANPVGRLMLHVFGYNDETRRELSDRICTGLQLANFWQDVIPDFSRGRVYIPQEDIAAFGCAEADIVNGRITQNFAELMQFQVDRTEALFKSASELPKMLDWRFGTDVALFTSAGIAVLDGIRKNNYDVLSHRPVISKARKIGLLIRCAYETLSRVI